MNNNNTTIMEFIITAFMIGLSFYLPPEFRGLFVGGSIIPFGLGIMLAVRER